MATLEEVLTQIRGMTGYVYDKPQGNNEGDEKIYTFWFTRDSDYLTDIDHYTIKILVMDEGIQNEDARVYTTRHIEQVSHAFRDALLAKINTFLQTNTDYEKAVIETLNEENEIAEGRAVKTTGTPPDDITTIINWVGFIKKNETVVTLRIIS